MIRDDVLCYCFGITREQIREHFSVADARIDELIATTGLATKCTACALDLDVLLDEILHEGIQGRLPLQADRPQPKSGLPERVQRVDSGFILSNPSVRTSIRLANFPPVAESEQLCAPHRFLLTIFDNTGSVCARYPGRLERSAEVTIDVSALRGCPDEGWFLLRQIPEAEGYYGTTRPQVFLRGKGWAAAYHTQFHRDATRGGRRAGMPLRAVDGKTHCSVSIINGGARRTDLTINLEGPDFRQSISRVLPGRGASIVDIDSAFHDVPREAPLVLRVLSRHPTRKNVINRHPDGSLGVDHFPNLV